MEFNECIKYGNMLIKYDKMNHNNESYINIYKKIYMLRLVENYIKHMVYSLNIEHPVHLGYGQEAVDIGFTINVKEGDYVVGYHRSLGLLIGLGVDAKKIISEVEGTENGLNNGISGIGHMIDPDLRYISTTIIGDNLSIANGIAYGLKRKGSNAMVTVFFGEATVSSGAIHEALNIASLWSLPVLFVCIKNGYAISLTTEEILSNTDLWKIAEWYGIKGYRVDGRDIRNIIQIKEEIEPIIRSGTPVFIECDVERLTGHAEGMDKFNLFKIIEPNNENDPLYNLEKFMRRLGVDIESIKEDMNVKFNTYMQ